MGFWGWDEIKDGVTLKGTVAGNAGVAGDDKDWDFSVWPARGFAILLTNPSNHTNTNGTIECEIKPLDGLGADNSQDQATLDKFLGNLDKACVTVTGTWAIDKSHAYDGGDLPLGSSVNGKTEIHPITSILVEHPPTVDNSSRLIEFLVFSGIAHTNSHTVPVPYPPFFKVIDPPPVPHEYELRQAQFDMPIPLGSAFQIVKTLDLADSHAFTTMNSGGFQTLHCTVSSGTPLIGKGFFFAQVKLPGFTVLTYLVSRGIDPKSGIRDVLAGAKASSVRALFNNLATGAFQPH